MRTLFSRFLLWSLAILLIAMVGLTILDRIVEVPDSGPQRRLTRFLMDEALRVYHAEGSPGLAAYLNRVESEYGSRTFLVDSEGRDLASEIDRSPLVHAANETSEPWFEQDSTPYTYSSDGAGNWFFLEYMRPNVGLTSAPSEWISLWTFTSAHLLAPERLWLMAALISCCYLLARNLTAPLRGMQHTLERFGKGDLAVRLNSNRPDELGQLARTFDAMAERIQSLLENQRNLLRDISHELRSPLTRLGLAVELAREESDVHPALNRIEKEAARLNTLVGELLSLVRVEDRRPTPRQEAFRLDEMLEELIDTCSLEASRRRCHLRLNSQVPLTVVGDQELLRRGLENVIRNALYYTLEDTDVIVTAATTPETILIRIRDFGPGVREDSLSDIFEPFYRIDNARRRETGGAGLGLAIALRTVEAHSGTIVARNVAPGLEVEIRFPCVHFTEDSCEPSDQAELART